MKHKVVFSLLLSVSVVAATLTVLTGCNRSVAQPPPNVPAVTVAPVTSEEIVEWDEFTGRIEAVQSVEVRPRVSGYVQAVRFQSGQLVKKGDVLFVIDPRWHQAEFDQRQAEFQQAQVRLENVKREADRTPQLLANKAISTEESEARQARYQEAKAALSAAQAAHRWPGQSGFAHRRKLCQRGGRRCHPFDHAGFRRPGLCLC
jgi:multidrug efflux pump subunit AcrA (membrane-fusion protein)